MKQKSIALLLILGLMLGLLSIPACAAEPVTVDEISAIPAGEWQREVVFPDWKGYVDDTLAMNSMVSFEGWHAQGYFYLSVNEKLQSFELFVNRTRVDTTAMEAGKCYRVDFSAAAKDGKNTIQLTGIRPKTLKEAVHVYIPFPVILDGAFSESGLAPEALKLVEELIASDVAYGFPGAQLAIIRHGRLVYENAWGKTNAFLPDGTPNADSGMATTDTLYDLASVTKMFATNYILQQLLSQGRFSLNDKVADYLGERFYRDVEDIAYVDGTGADLETQRSWKASLTIRDLLCHQAGFPADISFPNLNYNVEKLTFDPKAKNILYSGTDGDEKTKEATVAAICRAPLLYEPRTMVKYSDIDYMLLGLIAETLTGTDLDSYLKESFLRPMGLTHVTFNPLAHGFQREDCAATELNGNTRDGFVDFPGIRTQTLQGQVHDEKAWYSMGGVSGHAGLFANAADLAKLASVMLTGGYGENRFFSRNVMDLFMAPKSESFGQWGLGWWRSGDMQRPWYFGTEADSTVIGHQGWTGTLVMIDRQNDLVIVYLTNKINSPVTDGKANPNRFDGDWYTASTLGFVPQILTIGMDEEADVLPQLRALVEDMVNESEKLIPKGAPKGHPAIRNAESKAALAKAFLAETEPMG